VAEKLTVKARCCGTCLKWDRNPDGGTVRRCAAAWSSPRPSWDPSGLTVGFHICPGEVDYVKERKDG